MKKHWIYLVFLCFPVLAHAADSLSFAPPSTDYSVIFLGNLFGIVDGVLHGTGSQIMGVMFGVFNAAVLALGGIVVMYTLIIGTMNTAHEGQMLGQKWSSIWIPVRSTIGLAFLIPKASGYCLMQIFIMWVVVQGVGAADKIWNAALDYLNRGGAIVKAQMSMNSTSSNDNSPIIELTTGAGKILSGQVCMQGLQKLLEAQRTSLLKLGESGSGVCSQKSLADPATNKDMVFFCNNPVPDFISSVNVIDVVNDGFVSACSSTYKADSQGPPYELKMPYFTDEPYSGLNGVCGKIHWNDFNPNLSGSTTLSCSDIDITRQSRAVAIQQMYSDLTPVAVEMVSNDPEITVPPSGTTSKYSTVAKNQFGMPMLNGSTTPCNKPSKDCGNWGPVDEAGATKTVVLSGYELQNALMDYNGIMLPALNLANNMTTSGGDPVNTAKAKAMNNVRKFIKVSEERGWIMAGSYFFDLAYLNGMVTSGSSTIDSSSGLESSEFNVDTFSVAPFKTCATSTLCLFFNNDSGPATALAGLINGQTMSETPVEMVVDTNAKAITTKLSSTTYGYITNAALVHLPGQPGLTMPKFEMNFNIQPGQTLLKFPRKHFKGGFLGIPGFLANLFYNDIFRFIVNTVIAFIVSVFNMAIQAYLYKPLSAIMILFNNGVQMLQTTMVHPIIALAYMGASFINASVDIWINLITFTVIFAAIGGSGWIVMVLMILPFLVSWLGVMTSVGFIDAYYVPFIPYMIFTFGAIAWLMAVIESMVAGPIVALGVTHPEGHDALGKAEQAIMILVNVFLRPAMMIIGYIAAIALSYVAVFIINSGFSHVMQFLLPSGTSPGWDITSKDYWKPISDTFNYNYMDDTGKPTSSPYTNWAAIYASFFCLVTYTSLYLTVVQKAFTLIYALPDKILRWIGSQGESYGQDTSQWAEESKGQIKDTGEATGKSSMKTGGTVMGIAESSAVGANKGASGGSATAT